jgi:hypothetical protein
MRKPTIEDLTQRWLSCLDAVRRGRATLTQREQELREAAHALGEVVAPNDMEPGEKIAVWVRFNRKQEGLVVVELTGLAGDRYKLEMRQRRQEPAEPAKPEAGPSAEDATNEECPEDCVCTACREGRKKYYSDAKDPPHMGLIAIINGWDVEVKGMPVGRSLDEVRRIALKISNHTGQPAEQWEIRDETGQLLDPAQSIAETGWKPNERFFLTLKMGAGGAIDPTELAGDKVKRLLKDTIDGLRKDQPDLKAMMIPLAVAEAWLDHLRSRQTTHGVSEEMWEQQLIAFGAKLCDLAGAPYRVQNGKLKVGMWPHVAP